MNERIIGVILKLDDKSLIDDENQKVKTKKEIKKENKIEKKIIREEKKKERQREGKRKRRIRREKGEYKIFLWTVLGAFLVIIGIMIFTNYRICFATGDFSTKEKLTTEEKVESTLMTNGLAIIGIAISVWAGLNIVQVLEKGKLEALGKEVALYRKERCELNRRNFINNLLKIDDALNQHLYNVFSEIDDQDDNLAKFYFECNKIELIFQNLYLKQKKVERNLPEAYYNDAINNINKLLNIVMNSDYENMDVFIKYLKIRLAEIYFYLGYIVERDESIRCFQLVIDYFYEVFVDLKNPQKIMQNRSYLFGSKELTIYMFNTLGEANSKIIHAYLKIGEQGNRDNYPVVAQNVKLLYGSLIQLIEDEDKEDKNHNKKKLKREVYYRNYGCALERINEFEKGKLNFNDTIEFMKIKEQYQKAIKEVLFNDKESVREQTFYSYLSLYYKYIKSCDINNIFSKLENNENMENIQEFKDYTQDAYYYAKIALSLEPMSIYFWKIKAFVERDMVLWALFDADNKKVQYHYPQFVEWYENICRIERDKIDDDMRKDLSVSFNFLQKYVAG